MSEFPKVSVVISTYNRPAMLDRALESVHAQTFQDFEVVVVDDCSPDIETLRTVLEKWDANFTSRGVDMWCYRLSENSGYQSLPKQKAIEQARGDYIAYLDDDNLWDPNHLEVAVSAIESDLSTDLVYTRLRYKIADATIPFIVHMDGETCWAMMEQRVRGTGDTCSMEHSDQQRPATKVLSDMTGKEMPEGDAPGIPWDPTRLVERNFVDTSTVLHSKGAFWRMVRKDGFGWDTKLRRMADWNFIWRWHLAGNTAKLVDQVTVTYHWHAGSMQLTRPFIEVPVCFNFEQYQSMLRARERELPAAS